MPNRRVIDPENPPLTAKDFAQMRPVLEVVPPAVAAAWRPLLIGCARIEKNGAPGRN
jgi:hypothetical protein